MTNHPAAVEEVCAVIESEIRAWPKPEKRKKSKSNGGGIKITQPDKWFGLCVRERSNWTCEICGKHYEPEYSEITGLPKNQGLHCSHYIGRGNWSVRLYPDDANAHCYHCHSVMEGNPHVFKDWKVKQLGQERYDILIEKSNDSMIGKQMRREKCESAAHYQKEFERMRTLRAQGEVGRIEFVGYL